MGKAMTGTDSKALWGEDPDKKNPCSSSICLNYSHFRVQSYTCIHSSYIRLSGDKNATRGGTSI